jgi:hypothetical protein
VGKYFADNRRTIIGYHLSMTKDGPHVSVVSVTRWIGTGIRASTFGRHVIC